MTGTVTVNDVTFRLDRIGNASARKDSRDASWLTCVQLDDDSECEILRRDKKVAEKTAQLIESAVFTKADGQEIHWLIVDTGDVERVSNANDDRAASTWPRVVIAANGWEREYVMSSGVFRALNEQVWANTGMDDAPVWMVQVLP